MELSMGFMKMVKIALMTTLKLEAKDLAKKFVEELFWVHTFCLQVIMTPIMAKPPLLEERSLKNCVKHSRSTTSSFYPPLLTVLGRLARRVPIQWKLI